jgi:hypothetical protein
MLAGVANIIAVPKLSKLDPGENRTRSALLKNLHRKAPPGVNQHCRFILHQLTIVSIFGDQKSESESNSIEEHRAPSPSTTRSQKQSCWVHSYTQHLLLPY